MGILRTRGWGEPVVAAGCRGVSLAFPPKWLRHRGRAAARRARRVPAPRLMPSLVNNFISSAASAAVAGQPPPARSSTLPFRHAKKHYFWATPASARARARTSTSGAPTRHSATKHVGMVWGECARGATAVAAQRPPPRWPVAAQPVARSASGRSVSVPPLPPHHPVHSLTEKELIMLRVSAWVGRGAHSDSGGADATAHASWHQRGSAPPVARSASGPTMCAHHMPTRVERYTQ
jgi:hypothetical protein